MVLCCGVYVEEEWEDREVSSAGSGVVLWCVCGGGIGDREVSSAGSGVVLCCVCGGGMGGQRGIISCRKPMCGISTKYHSTCDKNSLMKINPFKGSENIHEKGGHMIPFRIQNPHQ